MTNYQLTLLFQAFNEGNLEEVLKHIHPEAEWHIFGDASLPIAEYNKGLENILGFFGRLGQHMNITINEPETIYRNEQQPEKVLIQGICGGIIPTTGKSFECPFTDTMTLDANGKILKYERLLDTLQIYLAFN